MTRILSKRSPRSFLISLGCAWAMAGAAAPGCGPSRPPTARVEGTVTLGGQPLQRAAVTFAPVEGGRPGYGATDDQGRFHLSTYGQADGAVLGEHVVTVYKVEPGTSVIDEDDLDGGPAGPASELRLLVPERYTSRETSDLRFTVARGMKPIEIALPAR